jgi:hypothetical protein
MEGSLSLFGFSVGGLLVQKSCFDHWVFGWLGGLVGDIKTEEREGGVGEREREQEREMKTDGAAWRIEMGGVGE